VGIIHASDWLNFAVAGWVVVSLLAAPLVGRFLTSALHERVDNPRPSSARESDVGAGNVSQAVGTESV
jgi:hypothetical protein